MLLGGASGSRVSHGAVGPAEEQEQQREMKSLGGEVKPGHSLASSDTTSVSESQREAVSEMEQTYPSSRAAEYLIVAHSMLGHRRKEILTSPASTVTPMDQALLLFAALTPPWHESPLLPPCAAFQAQIPLPAARD